MPVVESSVVVDLAPALAFAVSQTTGTVRKRWDPFIHSQRFLTAVEQPAKGVQTFTRHRTGMTMVSEYVSFKPPTNVGMRMVEGPWFFDAFAAGWQFRPVDNHPDRTEVVWRYNFSTKPSWLRPVADRVGTRILGRDIQRRMAGYTAGCGDPVVLARAAEDMVARGETSGT